MYMDFLLFVSVSWSLYRWGQKIECTKDREWAAAEAPNLD